MLNSIASAAAIDADILATNAGSVFFLECHYDKCEEAAGRLPLAGLPTTEGARIDSKLLRELLLCHPLGSPMVDQMLRHIVALLKRIVAEEPDDCCHVGNARLRVIPLPVRHRHLVAADLAGCVDLSDSEFKAVLVDGIPEGFDLDAVGGTLDSASI